MNHLMQVKNYSGNLKELAEEIGNMRYDTLEEFYKILSDKFNSDSRHDAILGHQQVSSKLKKIVEYHQMIQEEFSSLWKICEKYMKK